MHSLSDRELEVVKKCVVKVAKKHRVAAACVYGSKAAGYARPNSDIDLIVVLEGYPFAIKYAYMREQGIDLSILVVSKKSLEADARSASLGEFAVGRLLHIYEPIVNGPFLQLLERAYKKRVILEELRGIVDSTSLLGTEIMFPLEYLAFAKVRQRISRYPNATYSYYRTYARSPAAAQNLHFALQGYRDALSEILIEEPELLSRHADHSGSNLYQISDRAILVEGGKARLKLARRLQQVSSYLVHTYAGREVMHLMVKEAESKIRRRAGGPMQLPEYMSSPKKAYWRLAEGILIADGRNWLADLASRRGLSDFKVVHQRRLGNINSRTTMHTLRHAEGNYNIVVKELARTKAIKWAALSLWTSPVKRFKVGPLFRLGAAYKGTRFLRGIRVGVPAVEAIVLDRRLLVTGFIEGRTMADVIKESLDGKNDLQLLREAGGQIAKIHNAGASLGNIKPKNVIVVSSSNNNSTENQLFFTDTEQFLFSPSDQVWDIAQFISWDLKATRNSAVAGRIAGEFLQGYADVASGSTNLSKLANSRRYLESFFPLLSPSVARAIKSEVQKFAG